MWCGNWAMRRENSDQILDLPTYINFLLDKPAGGSLEICAVQVEGKFVEMLSHYVQNLPIKCSSPV